MRSQRNWRITLGGSLAALYVLQVCANPLDSSGDSSNGSGSDGSDVGHCRHRGIVGTRDSAKVKHHMEQNIWKIVEQGACARILALRRDLGFYHHIIASSSNQALTH